MLLIHGGTCCRRVRRHLPVIDNGIGAMHPRALPLGDELARTAEPHGLQERDADVPAGAESETFAHLDRVLGLRLAREAGRRQQVTP